MNLLTQRDVFAPAFRLWVGGMPLSPDKSLHISSISVSIQPTPPSTFTLQVSDPGHNLLNPLLSPFVEGKQVKIELGYVNHLTPLIEGEITALDVDFSEGLAASITVSGMDLSHRLSRGTTVRDFPATMDVAQILRQLTAEVGLTAVVDSVEVPPAPYHQRGTTNRELINDLVKQHNLYHWVEGRTLYFKKQKRTANSLMLEFGKDLISYSASLSTVGQVNRVTVRDRNSEKGQMITGTTPPSTVLNSKLSPAGSMMVARGAGGGMGSQRVLVDTGSKSLADAQSLAKSMLRQQEQEFLTGNGSTPGNPDIRLGTRLDLRGLGRFSGIYLVTGASHTFDSSGFKTSFQVVYNG